MTFPMWLLFAAAALSLWAGRWNATCWALALSYFVVESWTLIDGQRGAGDLFMIDVMTILLIYCKTIARDTECRFENSWQQFKCFLFAPTLCDRMILGLFIFAAWPVYVLNLSDSARWMLLWGAAVAQFIIAGGEAFSRRRSAKASFDDQDNPSSGLMKVAWAGVERWST